MTKITPLDQALKEKIDYLEKDLKPLKTGTIQSRIVRQLKAGWEKLVHKFKGHGWISKQQNAAHKLDKAIHKLDKYVSSLQDAYETTTENLDASNLKELTDFNKEITDQLKRIITICALVRRKLPNKIKEEEVSLVEKNIKNLMNKIEDAVTNPKFSKQVEEGKQREPSAGSVRTEAKPKKKPRIKQAEINKHTRAMELKLKEKPPVDRTHRVEQKEKTEEIRERCIETLQKQKKDVLAKLTKPQEKSELKTRESILAQLDRAIENIKTEKDYESWINVATDSLSVLRKKIAQVDGQNRLKESEKGKKAKLKEILQSARKDLLEFLPKVEDREVAEQQKQNFKRLDKAIKNMGKAENYKEYAKEAKENLFDLCRHIKGHDIYIKDGEDVSMPMNFTRYLKKIDDILNK